MGSQEILRPSVRRKPARTLVAFARKVIQLRFADERACRRLVAERTEWSPLVVVGAPRVDQHACGSKNIKPGRVQTVVAKTSVEAFDKRILCRLARFHEVHCDTLACGRLLKPHAWKLGTVVEDDGFGSRSPCCEGARSHHLQQNDQLERAGPSDDEAPRRTDLFVFAECDHLLK